MVAEFRDLVFRPHADKVLGHLHALHTYANGSTVSITRGGCNQGTADAPYEMMTPDGHVHAPLTTEGVTELLRVWAPKGNEADIIAAAQDLVSLWENQNIQGLPRAERNAAIEDTRNRLIAAVRADKR